MTQKLHYFIVGLSDSLKMNRFLKLLNDEGMMTTLLNIPENRNAFEKLKPQCSKPIFIVPGIEMDTKDRLNKVSRGISAYGKAKC